MTNELKARQAIKQFVASENDEFEVDEYVSHHLDELPAEYWQKHTGTSTPSPSQVIDLLVLRLKWENEETYDFTLPDEVTDYMLTVRFDDDGDLESIDMES